MLLYVLHTRTLSAEFGLGTVIIPSETAPNVGLAKRQHFCQCHVLTALYKQHWAIPPALQICNCRSTIRTLDRLISSSTKRLVVTLVKFLIRVWKIPGSNPDILLSSKLYSVTPGKCRNTASFLNTNTQPSQYHSHHLNLSGSTLHNLNSRYRAKAKLLAQQYSQTSSSSSSSLARQPRVGLGHSCHSCHSSLLITISLQLLISWRTPSSHLHQDIDQFASCTVTKSQDKVV
jgi:hypothetical protein